MDRKTSHLLTVRQKQQQLHLTCCVFFGFFQLDADRDEEEVFCDISMTLDNKLFSSKEPTAGDVVKAQWILYPDPQ